MNQNIADGIGWACQHQDLLTAGAVWFAAAVPASVTAWLAANGPGAPTVAGVTFKDEPLYAVASTL